MKVVLCSDLLMHMSFLQSSRKLENLLAENSSSSRRISSCCCNGVKNMPEYGKYGGETLDPLPRTLDEFVQR